MKPFLQSSGWHTIVTTQDLELDQEQKDVGMAVDMEYARKAAVFIGNGVRQHLISLSYTAIDKSGMFLQWSSFTSNIVHRRLVDGKPPISSRFY